MKKKFLLVILFSLLTISTLVNPLWALADEINEENEVEKLTALKETVKILDTVSEYDVQISVPGYEKERVSGYNFIIVMDGSYSTDGEEVWNKMRSSVIEMVDALLPEDDSSKNINKMALISFGVDYHINIPLTSDKAIFDSVLPYYKGGSLLSPGRSATNLEVGLKGAREYIENIMGTDLYKDKEHTYVIYLSDGGINLTETPLNYYNLLINNSGNYNGARGTLADTLILLDNSDDSVTYDELFDSMMKELRVLYSGNEDDETPISTIIDELGFSSEIMVNFLNEKVAEFFIYCGYDLDMEYSAGEFERMFVNKRLISGNNSIRSNLLNIVYYALLSCSDPRKDGVSRTIAEGNRLKEYATIYTIGYNAWKEDAKKILDPTYGENTLETHYSSAYYYAIADSINEKLSALIADIIKITYKNPVIVDYTSKWVNPIDVNGDGIFDEKDITITNNGQIVNDTKVTVEKLTADEISMLDDDELSGNINGDIYKITWNITEYLRSWDKYQLTYRVKVDTQEDGFVSDYEYRANGNVLLTYDIIETTTDGNGEETETTIAENVNGIVDLKDFVSQKENIILVTKTDDDGKLLSGSDFEIKSDDGDKQIVKEYSLDGINYTKDNSNYDAVYFRFSGLYDYNYILSETVVPDNYIIAKDMEFNFYNLEGITKEVTVVNEHKIGNVIVHYAVKIGDNLIPLKEFAYDEDGNLLPIFEGLNIEAIILSGNVGEIFNTTYEDIEGLNLSGLYIGDLLVDDSNIDLLKEKNYSGLFSEETQEFTYVYNLNIGTGEDIPLPPQTGYERNINYFELILSYILMIFRMFIF